MLIILFLQIVITDKTYYLEEWEIMLNPKIRSKNYKTFKEMTENFVGKSIDKEFVL